MEIIKQNKENNQQFNVLYLNNTKEQLREISEIHNTPINFLKKFLKKELKTNKSIFEINWKFQSFPPKPIANQITEENENKLITIEGIITKMGTILATYVVKKYECIICGEISENISYLEDRKTFPKSQICQYCKKKGVQLSEEYSRLINIKEVILQEKAEIGKNTHLKYIKIRIYGKKAMEITDNIFQGDIIKFTGILRIDKKIKNKNQEYYPYYLEALDYSYTPSNFEDIKLTENDVNRINYFKEIYPEFKDFRRFLINSFAPSVKNMDYIKYSILLQMVEGCNEEKKIHILLIGDPGTGKSTLLHEVQKFAPKCIFTSGKSTTSSGLSVIAERDKTFSNSEWVYRAGALVLANKGILIIDEFNHLSDEDRSALNQAMEVGQITTAKAPGTATFPAHTSIIAAANPQFQLFDPKYPIVQQFKIPEALLSRFSLVFILIDRMEEDEDDQITKHILSQKPKKIIDKDPELIKKKKETEENQKLIQKYIAYARNITPILSEGAADKINKYFKFLRSQSKKQTFPISRRYVQVLKQLSEANAKLRLSNIVEEEDVEEIIELIEYTFKEIKTSTGITEVYPETIAMTDKNIKSKRELSDFYYLLSSLAKEYDELEFDVIRERAKEIFPNVSEMFIHEKLMELQKENKILMLTKNRYKIIK